MFLFPIRCEGNIGVASILGNLQAKQGQLACTYLGLPLRTGRLHRSDEQAIVDRVAAKLPGWKGRLLNKAVLSSSSIPTYYMTIFGQWKDGNKPWSKMTIHHSTTELELFRNQDMHHHLLGLHSGTTVGYKGSAQKRPHPTYTNLHGGRMRTWPMEVRTTPSVHNGGNQSIC